MSEIRFITGRPAAFGRWLLVVTILLVGAQSLRAQENRPATSGANVFLYLPHVSNSLPALTLNPIGRPNSSNQWTVSWSGAAGVTGYELQESHDPDFSTVVTTYSPATTSQLVQPGLSFDNVYYYRVRAVSGGSTGPWSNVQSVMGGYRDDFDDPG